MGSELAAIAAPFVYLPLAAADSLGSSGGGSVPTAPRTTYPQPNLGPIAAEAGMQNVRAPQTAQGFIDSMGGFPSGNNHFMRKDRAPMPAPPPSHWTYEPGKGATWATPQRKGSSTEYEYTSAAPGTPGFGFKGNRI